MLQFEMEVLLADLRERTIEGVIVPYNETAKIAGREYKFMPGSVRAARARTPLLLDHDRAQPVGVLAALEEGPTGMVGRFRIDSTPAGDTALVQAASGSRGALSVGAEVVATIDKNGVLEVTDGLVQEVSLLALGAFPGAQVTRVAAEADTPDPEEPEQEEAEEPEQEEAEEAEEAEEEEGQEVSPDQETLDVESAGAAGPTDGGTTMSEAQAAAPMIITAAADRPQRDLSAGEFARYLIRAQHGEPEARRYLEAALTETLSTDISGLLPPQYEKTVIGAKQTPRPLYNFFRSRALPGVGLAVTKPKWTTFPVGAEAANVDADATTSKVVIGTQSANIVRWDWAGAFSWVIVQRSDPSVIDEVYGQAVDNFYAYVEGKIATLLAAAATDTATTLGAGLAKFFTVNKRTPDAIIVAPDVWGKLADGGKLAQPLGGGPVSTEQFGLTSTWGGIPIMASASIAATFAYLVTRRALDVRVTEPVQLTANAIGALNVEFAVVGEGLYDTEYAGEIIEMVPA